MTATEGSGREAKRMERLASLLDPATTTVVTMELQNGVVGQDALLPALVEEVARAGIIEAAASVCHAARAVGAHVVHCVVEHRADGLGVTENCTLFALGGKLRREQGIVPTEVGTHGAALVPELGPEPSDIVLARIHGMTPFTSTSLDQVLRNIGTRTIVAAGVSVNLGMLGLCISAVDLGYQTILVRDAVAGVPVDYADAVIDNTLSLITTVATTDEVSAIWRNL